VISHPDRRFYTLTDGIVSRYSTSTGGGKKTSVMMITADFARGSSGGPVFNDCGAVVGYVGSTVSVYYNVDKGRKDNLQMVFKQCIPTGNVLKLIKR
jgi:S1-C subfamily serine protease